MQATRRRLAALVLVVWSLYVYITLSNCSHRRTPGKSDGIANARPGVTGINTREGTVIARRKAVVSSCMDSTKARSIYRLGPDTKYFLHVQDEFKVMYCLIPKVATTSILQFMKQAGLDYQVNDNNSLIHGEDDLRRHGIRELASYDREEQAFRLLYYYKVIVVRHPLARWLSALKDKLWNRQSVYYKKYGTEIIRLYRQNITKDADANRQIDATEFVRYLSYIMENNGVIEQHWASYHGLCDPCSINYDYIAKAETLAEDFQYLNHHVYNNAMDTPIPGPYKNYNSLAQTREALKNVPSVYMGALYENYKQDFQAFGYNITL